MPAIAALPSPDCFLLSNRKTTLLQVGLRQGGSCSRLRCEELCRSRAPRAETDQLALANLLRMNLSTAQAEAAK